MKNLDSINHLKGKSVYLDDIPVQKDCLYGLIFASPIAHGRIINFDIQRALELPGVKRILTYKDIPGENQIGGIIKDEPLFAEKEIHFRGQAIALIIAVSEHIAQKARQLIQLETEAYPVITDPREAAKKGHFLIPSRTFKMGDTANAWKDCTYIFEGQAENGGQEHLYIETQGAYAYPIDNNGIKIHSSTQGPTAVQQTVAKILDVPMHRIEVDVARLGGAFGGKEDQASGFASMVALASHILQKPVKMSLHRHDDMYMTGKRHPYSSDYKIGLSKDLKILAYEAVLYQNGGAAADLSPAIMERTLFHGTNAYFIPNTSVQVHSCKTNLPPNTAFRGFGAPQAVFLIEAAIAHAAHKLGIDAYDIQKENFIQEGQIFPYGQKADQAQISACNQYTQEHFQLEARKKQIESYNSTHKLKKKGLSVQPICFGISFTKTPMNQARSLVHIYQDGSVGISTGAIEMGQGVNTKICQVAAQTLGIPSALIKIESTNTTRVANTSPTAASTGADLNGHATMLACQKLLHRLKETAAQSLNATAEKISIHEGKIFLNNKNTEIDWHQLVETAFLKRICLTENGHYATPIIHFDKTTEQGHPFAYHVYGIALTEVTLDCIRGTYIFDRVDIIHDFGKAINPIIDRGQVEGALMQGIGWMTMEELRYNDEGFLLSNSLSTYKVPDIYSAPKTVHIEAIPTDGADLGILKSKAVGEPPFLYGIGAYFAIHNAIKAYNPTFKDSLSAPYTHEKVLMALYQ